MTRFDLKDFEWSVIQPLLPAKLCGVKWVDDRRLLNGVFWWLLCRYRNLIERFCNKPKHFRAVATRHDKRDDSFPASVQLASIRICGHHNESVS